MSRTQAFAIFGFAAALLFGYFAWEWYLSPEARVKRALESAAAAAEEADVEGFVSSFSSEYGDFANRNRSSLEALVRESFGRVDRLNVTLKSMDVEVEGGEALTRLDVVVVAVRGEERYVVVGTPFEGEKLEVGMRREDGGWKIRRVDRRGEP
ncbi:MAG: nuclear transport factor 2 family protein [Vicinamibacteria bacterium]